MVNHYGLPILLGKVRTSVVPNTLQDILHPIMVDNVAKLIDIFILITLKTLQYV